MDARSFFRDAHWLTGQRVRGYALLLGLASLALLANSFGKAMGVVGTDFLAFWGAGHVTVQGDPALAYDLEVQQRVQTDTGSEGWFAFVNPPPFLFAVAPFGVLPFAVAWLVWVATTYALWAWVGVRAFPRLWPLVLVYPGALIAAGHAQNGLLTGALLVLAAHAFAHRPALSGAAIGALVIKPHLAVLAPFWFAASGGWRAFIAAGAMAVALILLSWTVFGTETLLAYTTSWEASAALMEGVNRNFLLRMTTFYSQTRLLAGDTAAVIVGGLSFALAVAATVLAARRFRGDPSAIAATALAATALASPYLFNYDLPFLIYPTLWLVDRGLRDGFRPYEKLALVALWFAPYATRAAALPLGINLMPPAALVLLWLVWSRAAAEHAGTRSPQ
jgi:hypothetical protein